MQNFIIEQETFRFTPKELFMRKTKKLSALILSAIMLATGCANNVTPGESTEIKDNSSAVADDTGTGDSNTDSGNSEPETKSVKDAVKDIKVDTKVKFLAWYNLNDQDIAKTYKELFGVPENIPAGYEKSKTVKSSSGSESTVDDKPFVDVRTISYAERYSILAKLIQSDDSPDAFPCEMNFAYNCIDYGSQLMYAPVDDIIDFSLAEFAQYAQAQQQTTIGKSNYVPVYDTEPLNFLWYRASVIKENGFEDPWELYEKNEWTWSKFLEMSQKFTDKENSKYAVDGYNVDMPLWTTTGMALVGLSDGKFKGNFREEKIISAMDYLRLFAPTQKGYRYPREIENSWSPSYSDWADGNTLFFSDGSWRYDNIWQKYKKRNKWSDDEINFVPFPRCDDEQTYYQGVNINSFVFPKGSKNPEGYKSLIYACAFAENDAEQKSAVRKKTISENDWNDKLLDRLDKVNSPETFVPVVELKSMFVYQDGLFCGECYINLITDWCYMNGEDYKKNLEDKTKGGYVTELEKALDEFNQTIK